MTTELITGGYSITPDEEYVSGNSFLVSCTVAGDVSVTFSDGTTIVVAVPVGIHQFNWAVTKVNSATTTATATFFNLG